MEAFGVGYSKAALGLSLYVIGCKFCPASISGAELKLFTADGTGPLIFR